MFSRTILVPAVVLLAMTSPLRAQDTATVTDRQLRQRLDYALGDTRKSIQELTALLARMETMRTAVHARITRDSIAVRPTTGTNRPTTNTGGTASGPNPNGGPSQPPAGKGVRVQGHDFNDGTTGPFGQWGGYTPRPVTVIPDPTGSGRGKVARVVYERDPAGGGSTDVNGGMYFRPNPPGGHPDGVGFGDSIYFSADLWLPRYPGGRPARPQVDQRKLLYLKFGDPSSRTGAVILNSWGRADGSGLDLALGTESSAAPSEVDYGLGALTFETWHKLEILLVGNQRGKSDGVVQVWLNGRLVKERRNALLFSPSPSTATDFIYEWGIGNQEQWAPDERVPMKDYRLWDNIEFRTGRP